MTKSDISKQFALLRKYGYKVINLNEKRSFRAGQRDFVDLCIFNAHYLVFVEVKIGKDILSEGQKDTAIKLSSIMAINKTVYYFQIKTLAEAKIIQEKILSKTL